MAIRIELLTPQGDFMQSSTYNKTFTQHGIIMVFFFLIPSIPATLGNFLIPMMIGAKDLAFPRINLLSWYIYIIGGVITIYALLAGGVDTGWTFYVPYSTTFSNSYVIATGLGIFINGFSSILTGLNFIVTIHTMRAPGMTWYRLPLFVWSHYATSSDHDSGHARHRDHDFAGGPRAARAHRHLRSGRRAAIRSCSNICSGSIRIRRFTSWCCRRWAWSAS
jgi:cytochrome c oxidase subunit 1